MGLDKPSPFRNSGENIDTYESGHGIIGQPEGCSFCGSLPGEVFMDLVRNKIARIEATDKSYKFYVKGIPRQGDPNELRVLSYSTGRFGDAKSWKELSRKEKRAVRQQRSYRDEMKKGFYRFTTWGETVDGKFYTHHLTPEQGNEFIKLWRAGEVPWGYAPYVRMYIPHTEEVEQNVDE